MTETFTYTKPGDYRIAMEQKGHSWIDYPESLPAGISLRDWLKILEEYEAQTGNDSDLEWTSYEPPEVTDSEFPFGVAQFTNGYLTPLPFPIAARPSAEDRNPIIQEEYHLGPESMYAFIHETDVWEKEEAYLRRLIGKAQEDHERVTHLLKLSTPKEK